MSGDGATRRLTGVFLLAVAALYVAWALFPEAALFHDVLGPHSLLALAGAVKLAFLASGALLAFACRDRLEEGNPARPAWALLSAGLFSTFVGQLSLAPYQFVLGETPYPSVADLYFVLSYPFFIASFLVLLRAYREAGFPVGSPAERLAIVLGGATLATLAAWWLLRPVAAGGGETLERTLSVTYPVLDLVLFLPLVLLLRIALRLRGSHVGTVWAELLAGFVFLCFADVFFAYFTALGLQHLDPWMHLTYILAYGLIAGGAHRQLRLLRS